MLWVYLTLFAILNIYCLIYFHQMNKELRKEITLTKEWCRNIIEELVEREKNIDEMLLKVIKEINNSKVNSDVNGIMNSGNMCEHHKQVYNDMIDEQSHLTNKILDIKKEHSEMISGIKDKFENFPGEQ